MWGLPVDSTAHRLLVISPRVTPEIRQDTAGLRPIAGAPRTVEEVPTEAKDLQVIHHQPEVADRVSTGVVTLHQGHHPAILQAAVEVAPAQEDHAQWAEEVVEEEINLS